MTDRLGGQDGGDLEPQEDAAVKGELVPVAGSLDLRPLDTLGGLEQLPVDYDQEKQHDWVRFIIVAGLLTILASLVLGAFLGLSSEDADTQKNLVQVTGLFVGPVTALIGAATGFYFGKESSIKERGPERGTDRSIVAQPPKRRRSSFSRLK